MWETKSSGGACVNLRVRFLRIRTWKRDAGWLSDQEIWDNHRERWTRLVASFLDRCGHFLLWGCCFLRVAKWMMEFIFDYARCGYNDTKIIFIFPRWRVLRSTYLGAMMVLSRSAARGSSATRSFGNAVWFSVQKQQRHDVRTLQAIVHLWRGCPPRSAICFCIAPHTMRRRWRSSIMSAIGKML